MIRTKNVPTWLVLAVQIQLDIHYVLLEDTSRAYQELTKNAKQIVDTLRQYQHFSKRMFIENWGEGNDRMLDDFAQETEAWFKTDWIEPLRTRTFRSGNLPVPESDRYYVLMKRHPVLCGMVLFRLKVLMQAIGITLVNAWGSLTTVLHLYNAAKVEGAISTPWMDLELAVCNCFFFAS